MTGDDQPAASQQTCADPTLLDGKCIGCGDRRGWLVVPDAATGDLMQIQCRACVERGD